MRYIRLLPLCIVWIISVLLPSASLHAQSLDAQLKAAGYVDVCEEAPSIRIQLKYATSDNFMGRSVYQGMTKAWLHPDAAQKLHRAQRILQREKPGYTLLVYDAARPMSVQRIMWNLVRGTNKTYYVSNPAKGGGLHNYGMAVDLTIVDASGKLLPMGTPYDFFGTEAHTDKEEALVQTGKMTQKELTNRRLLRRVMKEAGFRTVKSEWWHFNACSRETARARYRLIE
ncbi:D-alanyl-D-alanine dipeptidase [Tannerella forsythia]|mgnify:FL=1|uniref:M15 family metallopeptidase n=1 Tax=Tannerella forsythia TaxID=28112 RepID=UPI00086B1B9E|nr:M15 family metallopeptidase [Tannerella forsythia]SCQ20313.1 D-alanyl-D-alanine dipeptidase [Tannerella forsythia]